MALAPPELTITSPDPTDGATRDRQGVVERLGQLDTDRWLQVSWESRWLYDEERQEVQPGSHTMNVVCSECGDVAKFNGEDPTASQRARLRAGAHLEVPHSGLDLTDERTAAAAPPFPSVADLPLTNDGHPW